MEELFVVSITITMIAGTIIAVCLALFLLLLTCSIIKELIEELID